MKKFITLTTTLCAGVCALGLGGASFAFAETEEIDGLDYYPTDFITVRTCSPLKDYAVGDGKVLFLEEDGIHEYGGDREVTYENGRKTITSLYYEGGEFYYGTDDEAVYALKNFYEEENPAIEDFTYPENDDILLPNKYNYFFADGEYYFLDKNHPTNPAVLLDGFSNLKNYGDTVYAVKENVLYTLNGTEETPVTVVDFGSTNKIKAGGAYEALSSPASKDLEFVSLTGGKYMTEVNLDKLNANSEYFSAGDTVKINVADTPTALLLYKTGDSENGLSIIAVNGKSYLIHPRNTTPKTVYALEDSEYKDGTITMGYIYSAPFECNGTQVTELLSGVTVKILGEVRKDANTELENDFYLIEYTTDEGTVKGYVRFGLLSTFTFNEDPPETVADPGETYDDMIKPVVLILIVLLLIAIAVGYMVYVGTAGKRKNKSDKTDK